MIKSYGSTYDFIHGPFVPPASIRWEESDAPIFSPGRGFVSAFDYTCQLQVGCPGGCLFCYVPAAGGRFVPSNMRGPGGRLWSTLVKNKRRIAEKLKRALDEGLLRDKTIYWSGITDPYAAPPVTTAAFWRVLNEAPADQRPRRIAIQTRFRPDRDLGLISQYAGNTSPSDKGPAVLVNYSVGTDDTNVIRMWEKFTPSFEHRMNCVRKLREHGLFVAVTRSPFGPWKDLEGSMRCLLDLGVEFVSVLFFKVRTNSANTPLGFVRYLRSEYPFLLDRSWQSDRLAEIRGVFGDARVLVGREGFTALTQPQRYVHYERNESE